VNNVALPSDKPDVVSSVFQQKKRNSGSEMPVVVGVDLKGNKIGE